tara:strand:- start:489 stop:659 length:171 start_codon:yes stop_codon:yes gene_type:complete
MGNAGCVYSRGDCGECKVEAICFGANTLWAVFVCDRCAAVNILRKYTQTSYIRSLN